MDQHKTTAQEEATKLLESGDLRAAQSLLIASLKSNPNDEQGWFLLSFTCQDTDKKIYALHRALKIKPDLQEARERLDILEKQRHSAKPEESQSAAGECDRIKKIGEKSAYKKAEKLIVEGNLIAADLLLRDLIGANPDDSMGWYLLSFTETTRRGKINLLRQALRIEPNFTAANTALEELYQDSPSITSVQQAASKSKLAAKPSLKKTSRSFWALSRYVLRRGFVILATIIIGVYLTVLITNKGGQIDLDVEAQIDRQIMTMRYSDALEGLSREERDAQLAAARLEMEDEIGLNLPPVQRNLRWTYNALTFQWGEVRYLRNMNLWFVRGDEMNQVNTLILQYLPNTLLLFGAANLLILMVGIPLALYLASRGKNGKLDRFISMLSPISSVPSWVHGIILVTIFAVGLGILPYGGKYDNIPPDSWLGYIPIVGKHMILPVAAIFLSMIFQLIYSWRTYFLIYSDEDYVDLAQAKGLPVKMMERRYILRPTMPYIVTGFALTLVGFWQMSTALETFFNWPGIGMLYVTALPNFWGENFFPGEVSIILSVVVLFAFLLGFVVFMLDATYAVLDPRVRLGSSVNENSRLRAKPAGRSIRTWRLGRREQKDQALRSSTRQKSDPITQKARLFFANLKLSLGQGWVWFKNLVQEIRKYPSAIIGLAIICVLVGTSIYTVIALPYLEIGSEWRGSKISEQSYLPRNVPPAWVNLFRKDDYPSTIVLSSQVGEQDGVLEKTVRMTASGYPEIKFTGSIDYTWRTFPQGVYLYIDSIYDDKRPHISITWTTPDGRQINPKSPTFETGEVYDFSENVHPRRELRTNENWQGWFITEGQNHTPFFYYLFADPAADTARALPGTYQIEVIATTFEEEGDVDLELVMFGQVHGLAGTDFLRRDLTVPLLWGLPFTLAFGVTGAIVTTILAMIVAASGVWFGGWLDNTIQRITEANMILPILAVGILVFAFYGISLWVIMGIIILLNVFGSPTKAFRAAFLQVKEAPYIEAARAYGASNTRIIFRYMIPKIVPVLIPQLVMLIPALVFLEATLGIFNVFDPRYPTWGRVIYEAITRAALWGGSAYWYLEPIALLLLVGMAFALLGFALERILNPRLQEL